MGKKKKIPLEVKVSIAFGIISSVLSVFAIITSVWSVIKNNYTSQQVIEYQLEQERLPKVVGINYRLPININYLDTYRGNKIDFSSIPGNLYPITIHIYNVGVGIAQNCEIEWDQESINGACVELIELLKAHCNIHEFEQAKISGESGELWAYQDYIFPMVDGKHLSVQFDAYYASNSFSGYDFENIKEDLMCKDIQIPYLIPILNQSEPSYIPLPKGLSVLLLEVATHKIEEPISLEFNIRYQDLTGLYYTDKLAVTFLLNVSKNIDSVSEFQVSFTSTQAT